MTKGSKNSAPSAVAPTARIGAMSCVPVEKTVSYARSGAEEGSYQTKSQISYSDKQSGSYGRATVTEKATAGNFEWKNGTTGTRSEYKNTSTFRVGDKSGYTEVYNEQRVRDVSYNNSGGSASKDLITYDKGDGSAYGGYGYGNGGGGAYGGYGYGNGGGGAYGGYDYEEYDSDDSDY